LNPKVSIVVPAYNAEKTLKRCLDSLFDQDWDSYEVILVNDGSTDGTLGAASNYGDKSNFVVVSQPNKGIANSRWTGVCSSKGEYVGFVDADDCVKRNMFSKMYERASVWNADIAVCNWLSMGDETLRHSLYKDSTIDHIEKNVNLLIFKYCDGHLCNKIFKRELLSGEVFEKTYEVRYFEDIYFSSFVIPQARRITYLSDHLYCRFIHSASITRSLPSQALMDFLTVHKKIYCHFRQNTDSFYARKVPGLYMRGLLELGLIMKRNPSRDGFILQLEETIKKEKARITLSLFLGSWPGLKTLIMFFLDKVGLLDSAFKIWSSPFIRSIRNFRWGSSD